MHPSIEIYTAADLGNPWLDRYCGKKPGFICVLGFTDTALIPGISAAGSTPEARRFTAVADAEFLYEGPTGSPCYGLPPLQAGVSPAMITRAVLANQAIPLYLMNAGLPVAPSVPIIDLGGQPANCLSSGQALPLATVRHLFEAGLNWGQRLGRKFADSYLIVGECVVGGTTTAQAVLTALGFEVQGKVNSSHPDCNHRQKQQVVNTGLQHWQGLWRKSPPDPLAIVAALGDPMQPVVAGLALAASGQSGVLLAGGSQMMAVYALARALATYHACPWQSDHIVIGTTRWVVEDNSGDTVGLAQAIGDITLMASRLSFQDSRYPQLQMYERGFVKEGVGAGGCAIASHLYQQWTATDLQQAVEALLSATRGQLSGR
jgi:uncharacterized protein (TIGR00303 family)